MTTRILLTICAVALFTGSPVDAQIWKLTSLSTNSWSSAASSTNGARLAAVAATGQIFTSTNSGATWITNAAPAAAWTGVASSADGTRLAAVSIAGGIWTNGGGLWGPNFQSSPVATTWRCVAWSENGSNLVAAGTQILNGVIYFSTNSGWTWNKATAGNYNLHSLALAGNGANAFGAGSAVVASTNAGASWAALANAPLLSTIVCSSNGSKLAGFSATGNSPIYTSVDAGVTWITNMVGQSSPWTALTLSADGTRLAAASAGSGIYHSPDFGAHWQHADAGGFYFTSIASSGDGHALVATATNYILIGLAPLPALSLSLEGTNVSVSWTTNVAGYNLYLFYAPSLTNILWQFTPLPVITNNLYRVTMPATNQQIFFRLDPAA